MLGFYRDFAKGISEHRSGGPNCRAEVMTFLGPAARQLDELTEAEIWAEEYWCTDEANRLRGEIAAVIKEYLAQ